MERPPPPIPPSLDPPQCIFLNEIEYVYRDPQCPQYIPCSTCYWSVDAGHCSWVLSSKKSLYGESYPMWPESSRAPGIGEEHDPSAEKLLGLLLDTSRVKSRTNSSENMYISKVIGHFTARSLHSLKPSVTSQPKLSNMSGLHSLAI